MTARRLILAALTAMALTTPAAAAQVSGPNAEVLATVEAALSAGQTGDLRKLRDQYAPDCLFIDEFAPFLWAGPNAMDGYFASGGRMYQETQHVDGKVTFSPATFVYMSSDRAYVIEPVSGAATVRGKPYAVRGSFAFTLVRSEGRWRITSQAWAKAGETFNPYVAPAGR